ncbi:hypothetical protein SAMN05443247_04546 [Bradyrhizobium erythrophlei]|nr:hypothetical protein SAMN05443247_04546 [Bradyrhizobium erythrophlei]
MLTRGMIVELPGHQGIGKLLSANEGHCLVSVFHSVFRSEQIEMPLEQLRRGFGKLAFMSGKTTGITWAG